MVIVAEGGAIQDQRLYLGSIVNECLIFKIPEANADLFHAEGQAVEWANIGSSADLDGTVFDD